MEEMLELENIVLKDIIDFSEISLQKFDNAKIYNNSLVLSKGSEEIELKIPKDKTKLVSDIITKTYFDKGLILIKDITLSELKTLPTIDYEQQSKIKDYIDDLLFTLYFNIPVQNLSITSASTIKNLCKKNEFYNYIANK